MRSRQRWPPTTRTIPIAARSSRPARWPRPRPWPRHPASRPRMPRRNRWSCPGGRLERPGSTSRSWTRGPARDPMSTGSCGTDSPRSPGVRHLGNLPLRGRLQEVVRADPAVRKQIFLVTKDAPKVPAQIMGMLDKRLAALGPTTSTCSSFTASATTTRSTTPSPWSRARS